MSFLKVISSEIATSIIVIVFVKQHNRIRASLVRCFVLIIVQSAVLQYCLDIIFSLFLPTCISKIIKRLVITNNLNFTSDWRGYIKFSTFKHGQIFRQFFEKKQRDTNIFTAFHSFPERYCYYRWVSKIKINRLK